MAGRNARLGRTREALAQARLYLKKMAAAKSVEREQGALTRLAAVQAQVGQLGEAITGLDRLLATPAGQFVTVPRLKHDPTWDSIRHDPRFQALLKNYAAPASATALTPGTTAAGATSQN